MLLNLSPFSCLPGLKRNLRSFSCWALMGLYIVCFLIESNQAGVIKTPDTNITETASVNIVFDSQETEVDRVVLTQLHNASVATFSAKLQNVADASLATETSKELTNNEIVINEDKTLKKEADKTTTNETLITTNNDLEGGKTKDNFQALLHITETFENKPNESGKNSNEFSSNNIKEEKIRKLKEIPYENSNQNENVAKDKENAAFSESSLNRNPKVVKESEGKQSLSLNESENHNPQATSKLLTELKTLTEKSVTKSNNETKPLDNSIENSKESPELKLVNKADTISRKENAFNPSELTTVKTLSNSENSEDKILETSANIFNIKLGESLPKSLKTSTSVAEETESLEGLNKNSIVPFKDSNEAGPITSLDNHLSTQNETKQTFNSLAKEEETILNETTKKTFIAPDENTTRPTTNDHDLQAFEGDKKEYARSMFRQDVTTLKFAQPNEELLQEQVANFKPVKLSINEGIKEFTAEPKEELTQVLNKTNSVALNMKEKKPKFINDNSTNAQQLNLPNNAEVWSLAAMKSLPKSNITMETAHAPNETLQEFKTQQNTSTSVNNNSEKSLLDWSQIMMDKELSMTTRNEQPEATERNDKDYFIKATSLLTAKPQEEVITKNSLLEQEPFTTNTMPPVLTTTILSFPQNKENNNENLNLADKKVEENMNNHIETLTATFASANVDNNPFNTSLNIEPNLNEINLTSNQTKVDLNNEVHKTTAAEKQTAKDNVKANVYIEAETSTQLGATTSTQAEMPATTISTILKAATAVFNDDFTTVEQISSETKTPVSILETAKQDASLNNVAISEQQREITTKTYNVNKEQTNSASHSELDNNVLDKNQFLSNTNSDSITKTITTTTTTVIPITTFRPNILAITSTTSKVEIFEQETDQKSSEIQTNTTNTHQQQQQSIIKFDVQLLNNATTTSVYETTTLETLTTPSTATEHLTTTTKTSTSKNANSYTSSSWENNETTTTTTAATSFSTDVITNETTELNLNSSEQTTTQTTPKQENEQNNEGVKEKENTTGSAVLIDKKLENKEYQNTTTASTLTETPVVIITEKGQGIFESLIPTTETATTTRPKPTTAFTQANTIATTTEEPENNTQENILKGKEVEDVFMPIATTTTTTTTATKIMSNTQETTTISSPITGTTIKEEETYISLLDDTTTTITAPIQPHSTTISTTSLAHSTTTTLSTPSPSTSTLPSPLTTKIEDIYNVINSTTTEVIQTTQQLLTEIAEESTSTSSTPSSTTTTIAHLAEMLPPATMPTTDIHGHSSLPTLTSIMGGNSGNMYTKNSQASGETDVNVIIAITVSVIGVIALILLVGFLYLMRKRQKQTSYSQRCRPVSLDEYTIDNASVSGSMRKSSALRASKRTYGNLAFDDPTLRHNPMGVHELAKFVQEKLRIFEEFRDVPQITSRLDEVPIGCEDKNRYANVLPLPETRVILQRLNDDEKSEYINANYVTGPKDPPNYYIACQAPLESTVEDFWRMIWEQQSRVIIQATDLIEIGVEKCAEYLPPSVTLDNHSSYGDFQITLQNREVKDKYAISTLQLKHVAENATRELTHYWYKWPEVGVPTEEAPIIAMLLEARSSLISYAIEQANEDKEKSSVATLKSAEEGTVTTNNSTTLPANNANGSNGEINGNISMVHVKKTARNQGPLTIHCSPGTGRTGTIIACDIALRSLETPKRIVDIPQIVYSVRRGRASAVLTKEQYEFIYKVANMYAAKITNPTNYN